MDKKIKVCSSQYSNFFGNNQIHFPYTIASLIAYCLADVSIKEKFDFQKVFLFRDGVEDDIQKAKDADILLCSCYSWNWEITKLLAKEVKAINPTCIIVMGGPEIPNRSDGFFDTHPYADIIVHGEGEITLKDILLSYGKQITELFIKGVETKFKKSPPRERLEDLNVIPSPYSSGLIWDLVERKEEIKYIVSWETNRGCPFSCTYCDWGSSTMSKIRNFSEEKIYKEIEWFGENGIGYIDCCDGNFGIFQERDFNIAQKLVEAKKKTGCPERLNLTWVKTSSEKVIPTAKLLADADMLRAVSLSVQSLNEATLTAIKRKNIKFDKFEDLIKKFEDNGIQSYTELIMGLSEETVESYKNNWEILASIYPQPTIMTWNCSVFVNAPMNDPAYLKKYGIETFTSPTFMQHSTSRYNKVPEYEHMVRATSTLQDGKIKDMFVFNWAMMVFSAFGILELMSRYYNKTHQISYSQFFDAVLEYSESSNGLFHKEYLRATAQAEDGYSGKGWGDKDTALGDILWPIEESSWLRLTRDREELELELWGLAYFVNQKFKLDVHLHVREDLINFQLFCVSFPEQRFEKEINESFLYDWKTYFSKHLDTVEKKQIYLSRPNKVSEPDLIKWGYETVWFGRRVGRYKIKMKEILNMDGAGESN